MARIVIRFRDVYAPRHQSRRSSFSINVIDGGGRRFSIPPRPVVIQRRDVVARRHRRKDVIEQGTFRMTSGRNELVLVHVVSGLGSGDSATNVATEFGGVESVESFESVVSFVVGRIRCLQERKRWFRELSISKRISVRFNISR